MHHDWSLSSANINDHNEIARLSAELGYPADAAEIAQRLQVLLLNPLHCILVARQSSSLFGWIAAERRLSLESGESIEIVGLVVGQNARRMGVGKALVAGVEQWARDQNMCVVRVRSNVTRGESHPFYASLGYEKQKTQHAYKKRV